MRTAGREVSMSLSERDLADLVWESDLASHGALINVSIYFKSGGDQCVMSVVIFQKGIGDQCRLLCRVAGGFAMRSTFKMGNTPELPIYISTKGAVHSAVVVALPTWQLMSPIRVRPAAVAARANGKC